MDPLTMLGMGLSVLPKVPAIWGKVARIFGKEPPQAVDQAANLVEEIRGELAAGRMTPEQRAELERTFHAHRAEILDKYLDHVREMERILAADAQGVRDLEAAAYQSGDPYVSHTRPKILRQMWGLIMVLAFAYPAFLVLAGRMLKPGPAEMVADFLLTFFTWLSGVFAAAFIGYAAARTIDKRGAAPDPDTLKGKLFKYAMGGPGRGL